MNNLKANYFHELYRVALAINSPIKVRGVLRSIVRSTTTAMNVKGCSIMLFTPDKKSLVHKISYGLSKTFVNKGPRLVRKSLPETVKGKGTVAIVHDVNQEKQRVQYPEAAVKEGIVSILAVPMKLRRKIVGELRIYSTEKRDFSEDDIFFVQAVANLGALAIDNARLYEVAENFAMSV
jgi:signal transduction protein with GAF and PtsI domain